MKRVFAAAATVNQTPLDWDANRDNLLAAIAEARKIGASILCTPELGISGYGAEDAFLWPATRSMSLRVLEEIRPHTAGMIVAIGLPLEVGAVVYNAAALLVDGELLGIALKRHLAGSGLHYEPRWFGSWAAGTHAFVQIEGKQVPVGDLLFDVGGFRIGFEICEDAWVEPRPGSTFVEQGAHLILSPSASHFSFRKFEQRRMIACSLSRRHSVHYIYANLLGNEAGRAIYDGDAFVVAAGGQVLASSRRLSFAPVRVIGAELSFNDRPDEDRVSEQAKGGPYLVRSEFSLPSSTERMPVTEATPSSDDQGRVNQDVAFARVLSLGLFDYMRKSKSRGCVVSLSGGVDSASTAVLVWLMLVLSCEELGARGAVSRLLGDVPTIESLTKLSPSELCGRLLLTVYQKTANSSEVTKEAARAVAASISSEHHEIDVETLIQQYRALTEAVLARPLNWERDDVALQNIQARARAPSVWMLANVRGSLLLSTSNRSESAVGYATMDGDTAGGLCLLGGIDKSYLRNWLIFMEEKGLPESGALPGLRAVNLQAPTAELRPPERKQTDEQDLMPYDVLDAIERLAICERLSPREVSERLVDAFTQHTRAELVTWVVRFYRLFAQNQWKRERYAPSFHVDEANLDPKTWCRFPILSGGFARELSELESEAGFR